ncbi:MAG TPA: HEAT repeat domain-containing protein, partial [Gemmataceae bacterium]|nr:HEAT repeat domain-containing protein [Gemmataceae bacterium]
MPLPLRLGLPLGLALLAPILLWAEPADDDDAATDENVLHEAGLPTDGPGLLDYFHRRLPSDADSKRAPGLIRQLADDNFDAREKATADLTAIGPPALSMLQDALNSTDPEVRYRAQRCLAAIRGKDVPQSAQAAAVRTLGRLQTPGAVETLLAALPSLYGAELVDEACKALASAGVRMGQVDPLLVQALGDPSPLRRAAAGEALTRAGVADLRPAVEKLLHDADAAVRQRVALALLNARDKEAIPTLIALLGDVPRDQSGPVEEALRLTAGDQAPSVSPGDDADSRRQCRDLWEKWWKEHGRDVDLAKIDFANRHLGYTLVAEMDLRGTTGNVIEYDAGGKERWRISGLRYPVDAQMVGADHVLIAEYVNRTVSERTIKGDIVWQYNANNLVLSARRLPDGDTFVASRNQLTLLDKNGKEKSTIPRPSDVCAAAKFHDGSIALLTNAGLFMHLDESGKQLKSLQLNLPVLPVGANVEPLPDGHAL